TEHQANKNVVIHIPDRGRMRRSIIKQIIWFAFVIEIRRPNQSPARGKSWPVNTAQERYTRQIPDRGLARVEIKEREIGMTVTIEIREIDQAPTRRKRLPISASDKNVIIQIPDSCLPCTSAIQNIIGFAVAVNIGEKSARRQARDIVTEHIQRDSFWRANCDISRLALTCKCILHMKICLGARAAQAIAEIASGILVQDNHPARAAID